MAKEVKERAPSSFNSKFGFESEFTLSSGHSQDHLEMVCEQGEHGELPNSLLLTPDPHPKTTIPLLRSHKHMDTFIWLRLWTLPCLTEVWRHAIQCQLSLREFWTSDTGTNHRASVRCRGRVGGGSLGLTKASQELWKEGTNSVNTSIWQLRKRRLREVDWLEQDHISNIQQK